MTPGTKFDKPAKSPFMNMMLVPVYADSDADTNKITVSARTQQNLGVRTALVAEGKLSPQLSAVGNIAYNGTELYAAGIFRFCCISPCCMKLML